MSDSKKVLTTDNLVTIKEILDATYGSGANLDESNFKTINGQSIIGSGDIDVQGSFEWKTINGEPISGAGDIDTANARWFAPIWTKNTEYAADDFVTSGTKLYKCTESHVSASKFSEDRARYWEESNIFDNIGDIVSSLFERRWEEEVSSLLDQEL